MAVRDCDLVKLSGPRSQLSISTGDGDSLPIEVTLIGKFPPGAGKFFVDQAFERQAKHPEFLDEFNEPSAIIGKTNFQKNDPTAVYTFGVDKRDLVFHRHAGHRAITGITGSHGCNLKFSLCTPEEAEKEPEAFLDRMYIVHIPADTQFMLRFSGTVYHQFCPGDYNENAFFAVSVHTNEAEGLSGELLEMVLDNQSSIPLLTEPACDAVMKLLHDDEALKHAHNISMDLD